MSTRSGRPYNNERQRAEMMAELIRQVAALNQKVEVVWDRLFPEPNNLEDEHAVPAQPENSEVPFGGDPDVEAFSPRGLSPQRPPRDQRMPPPNIPRMGNNFRNPYVHQNQRERHDLDDVMKRVRVEVADYSGSMDPTYFQDWLISLEDYFE